MPYSTGEIPEVGDHVRHRLGQTGKVTHVDLDAPNTPSVVST